jgi:hypothetical protein
MIRLTCTHCQEVLSVDDAFAGGVCRCRHCGTIQTVPKKTAGNRGPAAPPPKTLYRAAPPGEAPRQEPPASPPAADEPPPWPAALPASVRRDRSLPRLIVALAVLAAFIGWAVWYLAF